MAKRKDDILSVIENESIVLNPEEVLENESIVLNPEEILENESKAMKADVETEGDEGAPEDAPQNNNAIDEIPARVKKILSLYPNYKELYVDNKGGVYTTAPKHSAQLYKNPYSK